MIGEPTAALNEATAWTTSVAHVVVRVRTWKSQLESAARSLVSSRVHVDFRVGAGRGTGRSHFETRSHKVEGAVIPEFQFIGG